MVWGIALSLYISVVGLPCALILEKRVLPSITENTPKALRAPRHQTALYKEEHDLLMIAAQASHLLHHSHVWQETTVDTVHCWEPGKRFMLPVLLILWHDLPLFLISDLCGKFAAGGFHGAPEQVTPSRFLSSLSN